MSTNKNILECFSLLPERLTNAIKRSGLSYRDLERITGIPNSTIHHYSSGRTKKVPLETLQKLASALEVTPEYLYGIDELETRKGLEASPKWQAILAILETMPEDQVDRFLEIFRQQLELMNGQERK